MATNKMTKCKSCGNEISAKGKVTCPSCGRVNKKPIYKRAWFIVLSVIIVISVISVLGSDDSETASDSNNSNDDNTVVEKKQEVTKEPVESKLALGSTVELRDFTIVFNSYTIEKIDNQFADVKEAIVISTTITNTSDETESMFAGISSTCFAPDGTEAGDESQLYLNDEFPSYWHDELRSKAVLETFFVCNYSVDGEYIIEIGSMFGDPQEVFIDIKK